MDFWKNAADSVTKAVDFVVDKNRKTAMMNRLKIVIKNEKESQNHAYAQLGKYYYQNLRDVENGDTEPFCLAIDTSASRLKRAYAKLDELAVPTAERGGRQDAHGCDTQEDDDFSIEPEDSDDFSGESVGSDDFSDEPDDGGGFHPDVGFRPDAEHQEAADEDENYLHPFSVVPNDRPEESEPEDKPEEKPEDVKKE